MSGLSAIEPATYGHADYPGSVVGKNGFMKNQKLNRRFEDVQVALEPLNRETAAVRLSGELGVLSSRDIGQFIFENLDHENQTIILMMNNMTYMDSSGIKLIEKLRNLYGGDRVAICGISPELYRLLEVAALVDQIPFIDEPKAFEEWSLTDPRAA